MGLWVDTDMGVDDLFAVLLVAQHKTIDGLSLSFGNAPLNQVITNTAGAASHFKWETPIHAGADCSLLGTIETAQRILGTSGMPSRGERLPEIIAKYPPAQAALANWLARQKTAEILCLGPLTNLAILALSRPDLLTNVKRITWMGGALTRGNHTASAEFNALADPEALAVLLARNLPITMIDLDACRKVEITEADVQSLKTSPLLSDLLGGYLDIALSRGRSAMALYDPVAAAAVVAPQHFDFAPAHITVELTGHHTRGRTIVDQRDPKAANAMIARDLDAPAVKSLCLAALEAYS